MNKPILALFLILAFLLLTACGGGGGGSDSDGGGGGGGGVQTLASTDEINTATVRSKITGVCLNCHNGTVQEPNMSTAPLLKANASRALNMLQMGRMPPDDSGFPKLTACQLAVFREWVNSGTPDESDETVGDLPGCDF